ncbi:hypothetical protein CMUS01_09481 [Colletotrichum musicola]|uniref:Uncharacterized protein n=1 Tax=Colletotrichum musicola TaxID=2175873 RepID=A0A8H6K8C3_9PEZI|nr:hypothetical protein CMUS01_09481 [Colletotrichum musicola]
MSLAFIPPLISFLGMFRTAVIWILIPRSDNGQVELAIAETPPTVVILWTKLAIAVGYHDSRALLSDIRRPVPLSPVPS